MQRWLGHHKPSFTLDRYVHLLDQDVPEPTFFDALASRGDHSGDQWGDQEQTKQAETLAMPEAENPSKSVETPDQPSEAETPAVNY